MLDKLFTHILDMSATGSIVIAVVLLARLALKRVPKIFSYCLWAVVLLRLLCPVDISAPVSVVPTMPSVSDNYSLADEQIGFSNAGAAAIEAIGNVTNYNPDTYFVEIQSSVQTGATTITCSPWEVLVLFGQYVWVVGVAVMVLLSLVKLLQLRWKLSEAVRIRDHIYLADGIATPFVMGLFLPKIYLPSGLTEAEQQYVLRHETHHIHRLDHISKALGFMALCLHWFNPLVWLGFVLAGQDMGMSCDEAVIKQLGSHVRADYSQSLLRFTTGRTTIAGAPLAFDEGDAGKRIRNLSKWKQPKRALTVLATVVCLALTVGCATSGMGEGATLGTTEVYYGTNAELIFDVEDEDFDASKEYSFSLPEYPGVTFLRSGGSVYAQENGTWRRLLQAYAIYVADLNGDGKREFCGTMTVGSGIMDHRIRVYDYVDDMIYCLEQRARYDYELHIEDGKLIVDRYHYMDMYEGKAPVSQGALVLKDRQLTFVSGETTVAGYRSSVYFNTEMLESMVAKVKDYESRSMQIKLLPGYPADYYMNLPGNDFSAALITEEVDGSIWLDLDLTQGFEAEARYLTLLHMMTSPYYYIGSQCFDPYIYQDPANPAQLFICTEIRDCGYRDIAQYYEAVVTGQCQPHADTYIVRLDERAIYHWGKTENIYALLDN